MAEESVRGIPKELKELLVKNTPDFKNLFEIETNSQEGYVVIGSYQGIKKCAVKYILLDNIAENIEKELKESRISDKITLMGNITDSVKSEITLLSTLYHPHLVRILRHGAISIDPIEANARKPFYSYYIMMEFAEGDPILKALDRLMASPSLIIRALQQLFATVAFLHDCGVLHTDLKSDNVMLYTRDLVSGSTEINTTMIDLGSAVVVDLEKFKAHLSSPGENDKFSEINSTIMKQFPGNPDKILLRFDEKTVPKNCNSVKRLPGTSFQDREYVKEKLFPVKDLLSLSLIVSNVKEKVKDQLGKLSLEGESYESPSIPVQSATGKHLYDQLVKGLSIISDRLCNDYYIKRAKSPDKAVAEALKDLERIDPTYLSMTEIPELSTEHPHVNGIMLMDQMVWLSPSIQSLIYHPYFNRLFFVPQLEFEYLVFPDARYSRGVHSLLTFHYARRAILLLLSDVTFRLSVTKELILGTMIFSLLHDIGHYPLSHMFEDMTGFNGVKSDDDMFPLLIGKEKSTFFSIPNNRGFTSLYDTIVKRFSRDVADYIMKIWACVDGNEESRRAFDESVRDERQRFIIRLLSGIISSATDVDKIAYLTHDSKSTGAKYGLVVDPDIFLYNLTFPDYDSKVEKIISDLDKKSKELPVLFIKDSALTNAETIVMARYWMISRVYWHRTNRAITSAFKFVISEIIKNNQSFFQEYISNCFYYSETQALEYLCQYYEKVVDLSTHFNPLSDLAKYRSRDSIFMRAIVFSSSGGMHAEAERKKDIATYHKLSELASKGLTITLTYKITDKLSEILSKNEGGDKKWVEEARINPGLFTRDGNGSSRLKYGTVLLDIPRKMRDKLYVDNIILVPGEGKNEEFLNLSQKSIIFGKEGKSIEAEFLDQAKKYRIFIHRELYSLFSKYNANGDIKREISDIINNFEPSEGGSDA